MAKRTEHTACWLGETSIVLTGGNNDEKNVPIDQCEMFENGQWKQLPALNQARKVHSSAAFNNNTVYVFCGHDGNDVLNSIEKWTLGDHKWTTIETNGVILDRKTRLKSVQVNHKFILIFGG